MRGGTGIPEAGRGTGLDDEDDDDAMSPFFWGARVLLSGVT